MHQVTNPIQACNDIFLKPNGVFHAVGEKHNWSWLPFFIVTVMAVLPGYLYFSTVDITWYQDLIMSSQYADASPAERDAMRQSMTRTAMSTFAIIGTVLGVLILNAVFAGYLNVATRSDEECVQGFTDWYGFTWWVSMPMIFNSIVAIALLFLADTAEIAPTALSPLSLAYLLNIPMDSDWFGLTQTLRLDVAWSAYLMTVGVRQWTHFNAQKATTIALAPCAVILGIWLVLVIV
ncbi:Yip1 family protein [Alteromonas sp. CYL-A6]|uniref:Yip1 family protein n=1 Tax=Alteromonas nitratireducens TaxID=3390813 RepID=UPI0034AF1D27